MASLKKRNGVYYAQWYVGAKQKRKSLQTGSYQLARAKLREMESRLAQGEDNPLPSRTPIAKVLSAYVRHVRAHKTAKSAQVDISYLRRCFGECCPELANSSRKANDPAAPQKRRGSRRAGPTPIEAACFEAITTAQASDYLAEQVRSAGLKPKTANRYREVLHRLFAWAIEEGGVRTPAGRNPVTRVKRYRESPPEIRYLTLAQIDEQLEALSSTGDRGQLRAMVALYIYAGLRREEALWLQRDDVKLTREGGVIRVRAKTVGGESWRPKTARNRAVPISTALAAELLRYAPAPSVGDWYFPSPQGSRWDPDNFSHTLKRAQKRAGLQWACLDYRHTFGSQLAQKGVSLYKISTLMGNSPEICRRHYAALVPEALTDEVEFRVPLEFSDDVANSA